MAGSSIPRPMQGAERPGSASSQATLGLILAGGLARRMGGGDKALRRVGGRSLLERVIERLRPQCAALLLNANGDPARFGASGLEVVADDVPGHAGPLAGILAGLDWAARHRPDLAWVASAAVDTPFIPGDLVRRLHAAREAAGTPLACAMSGGRAHPVNGLWPVALREGLRQALGSGERRVGSWTARHGVAYAEWGIEPVDPFFNLNAPADLTLAERLAARAGTERDPRAVDGPDAEDRSPGSQGLDLRGLKCPFPVLKTRKALRALASGARLTVSCTDRLSALDIPNLLRETGDTLEGVAELDGTLVFRIVKR